MQCLQNEYFSSGSLKTEKDLGFTSIVGNYGSATNVSTSSVQAIWTGGTSAILTSSVPTYSDNTKSLYSGALWVAVAQGGSHFGPTNKKIGYNTSSKSSCDSISGTNCIVNNANTPTTTVNDHGSTLYSDFQFTGAVSTASSFAVNKKLYDNGSVTVNNNHSQKVLDLIPCGGSLHGKTAFKLTATAANQVSIANKISDATNTWNPTTLKAIWQLAGHNAVSTSGTTKTFNNATGSNCVSTYTITYSAKTYNIRYRLRIRVTK